MTIKINAVNLCILVVIIVVIAIGIRKRTTKLMQGFVGSSDGTSSNLGGGGGGAGGGGGGLIGENTEENDILDRNRDNECHGENYMGSSARGQRSIAADGSDISLDGAFRKGFSGTEREAEHRRDYEREIGPRYEKRSNNYGNVIDGCISSGSDSCVGISSGSGCGYLGIYGGN